MAYISRDDQGNALSTPNGDHFMFTRTAPKWTIHNWHGMQVDAYDDKALAVEALNDIVWDAKLYEGVPSRHYLVRDAEKIVMQRGSY
jgi:hypothetical protein